jgi:STE24 endopeptidase
MNSLDFSHEDVERAARYHRPLYLVFALSTTLTAALYAVLEWTPAGERLWSLAGGLGWAGSAAVWALLVMVVVDAATLPLGIWRGYFRERRWGFSTQGPAAWFLDRAKGLAVGIVLTGAVWTAAVGLARASPRWWPALAAGGLALAVLVLSFVAPVVLEPLFNRFRALEDEELAETLRMLAQDAGVPIRDVLVADASRRTTKANAYVSGLGRTRRVVLFDTLLASSDRREVALVVAHELGHRLHRHVAKGTALAMAGAALAAVVVWAVLGSRVASPRDLPFVLLLGLGLELAVLVPGAAVSRRWERAADRCSLELTHDLHAFERAHAALARRNLSDLAPPRLAYLFLFTHPTPPERIASARVWAAGALAAGA